MVGRKIVWKEKMKVALTTKYLYEVLKRNLSHSKSSTIEK